MKNEHDQNLVSIRFSRNLKQRLLERLREDFVLAWLYRHPRSRRYIVEQVEPDYMTTTTGHAICSALHDPEPPASLTELDRIYRKKAQDHPESDKEVRRIRAHIARLWKAPRSKTRESQNALEAIRGWCKDRRMALSPLRKLPSEELHREADVARKRVLQVSDKIRELRQIEKQLYELIEVVVQELDLRSHRRTAF